MHEASIKGITVLGSTGSIGLSTVDVVERHPEDFRLVALTANQDVDTLFDQCLRLRPAYAAMADEGSAAALARRLKAAGSQTEVDSGVAGLERMASLPEVDAVMAAIVGAAGLMPALAAVRAGKRVLLANKEALVMSGELFIDEVRAHGAELLPIDSEHNAVFQCLPPDFGCGLRAVGVDRILLTASGGPFRQLSADQLERVTPEQACAHPNWEMGRKISVDSATLMNKGLEVIEACWLFGAAPDQVEVIIHPQSIVHSLVSYTDGSVLAQLGNPDMRTPIAHALGWPRRIESGVRTLDLVEVAHLAFEAPDESRFPCLRLARQALEAGGTASTTLNAANEEAVRSFLEQEIGFMQIPETIEYTLRQADIVAARDLDTVLAADRQARALAGEFLRRCRGHA